MRTSRPYGPHSGITNHTALQQARSKERERERQALIARAPFDAAADAVERAERALREAFERLPPAAADLKRDLILHAVAATGITAVLRRAAERAQADVTPHP